jgi:ribosome-binding protein aMBF1 (putative translation factor)
VPRTYGGQLGNATSFDASVLTRPTCRVPYVKMSRHASTTSFADRLKLAQAQSELTNEELARKADIRLRALQRYRSGQIEPKGQALARLCVALDRPIDWFYDNSVATDGEAA